MTIADSTFLPPLPTLKDSVLFVYWKYSFFPKDSAGTASLCQQGLLCGAITLHLSLILAWSSQVNHHVCAAFLLAEDRVQIMTNFAFGYTMPQGHESNEREVYIQTNSAYLTLYTTVYTFRATNYSG